MVHAYSAEGTVIRVDPLNVLVIPDHCDGDRKAGKAISVPRALNPKRNETNRITPIPEQPVRVDELGLDPGDALVRRAWLGLNDAQRRIALMAVSRDATARAVHAAVRDLRPSMTALELCDALTLGRFHLSLRSKDALVELLSNC